MRCPNCGYEFDSEEEDLVLCEVAGCANLAEWEGWYEVRDPMLGTPTGLVQKRSVCSDHKYMLRGSGKDELD
jgi:hypothetical protein